MSNQTYNDSEFSLAPAHSLLTRVQNIYNERSGTNARIRLLIHDDRLHDFLSRMGNVLAGGDNVALEKTRHINNSKRDIAVIIVERDGDEIQTCIGRGETINLAQLYDKQLSLKIEKYENASDSFVTFGDDNQKTLQTLLSNAHLSEMTKSATRALLTVHPTAAAAYFRMSGGITSVSPFAAIMNFRRWDRMDVSNPRRLPSLDPADTIKALSCGRHVVNVLPPASLLCPLCDDRYWRGRLATTLCKRAVDPDSKLRVLASTDDGCVLEALKTLNELGNIRADVYALSSMKPIFERFNVIIYIGSAENGVHTLLSKTLYCVDDNTRIISMRIPNAFQV